MSSIKRIAKNAAALFVSQTAVSILSFILSVVIARYLGNVTFGKYSFAVAYVSFFILFSEIGYNTLIVREIAKDKTQATSYISNILGIRLLASILVLIIIIFSANILRYPNDTKIVIYLFGLSAIVTSVSDVFRMSFRAFEKMEYEAITKTLLSFLRTLLGVVILYFGYGLTDLALLFLITSLFDLIFSLTICKKIIVKPKVKFEKQFFLKTIKVAVSLGSLSFLGILNTKVDTIMLAFMVGDAAVGWYNAAYNLILGFKPLPKLIMFAIFPIMSAYYTSSYSSLKMMCKKVSYYFFMVGLPFAVGTTLLSDRLILIIYGQQFLSSIIALRILSWDLFLQFLIVPLNMTLISMNHEKKINVIFGLAVFVNIVLNLLLIPRFSYIAAASTTILSETLLLGLYMYIVLKEFKEFPLSKNITFPIIGSLVMTLFILHFGNMNLFLLILLSAILYFVVICVLHGIPKEDIEMFNIYKNKK